MRIKIFSMTVVNLQKKFSSAAFFDNQAVESFWDIIITCWESLHIGYPEKIFVDNGRYFTTLQ